MFLRWFPEESLQRDRCINISITRFSSAAAQTPSQNCITWCDKLVQNAPAALKVINNVRMWQSWTCTFSRHRHVTENMTRHMIYDRLWGFEGEKKNAEKFLESHTIRNPAPKAGVILYDVRTITTGRSEWVESGYSQLRHQLMSNILAAK